MRRRESIGRSGCMRKQLRCAEQVEQHRVPQLTPNVGCFGNSFPSPSFNQFLNYSIILWGTGCAERFAVAHPGKLMPHVLPPHSVVYQRMRRRLKAKGFDAITCDPPAMLRIVDGRRETPTAATFANRRLQSLSRASYAPVTTARNDARATKFISRPTLWDICTLGHLPVLCVSAADEQGRPRGRTTTLAITGLDR